MISAVHPQGAAVKVTAFLPAGSSLKEDLSDILTWLPKIFEEIYDYLTM